MTICYTPRQNSDREVNSCQSTTLDTSALMKRYIPEIGSDVMEELFAGLTDSDELGYFIFDDLGGEFHSSDTTFERTRHNSGDIIKGCFRSD